MGVLTMWRRVAAIGIAAALAVGGVGAGRAAPAAPATAAITPAAAGRNVVAARMRVPRGILSGVPTGGDPYWASRPQPYLVLSPLAAPAAWAPFVLAPILAPPILAPAYEFAPIGFGPCFVPTEHTGQLGYYGSCPESYYRELTNRPD